MFSVAGRAGRGGRLRTSMNSVHFSTAVTHYYKPETLSYPSLRRSVKENCILKSVLAEPKTELGRLRDLIASWRNNDISVVFGNLGRQPYLLNFYLDECFSHEDDVKVFCPWEWVSDYQTKRVQKADFLIYVEPHFGYTVKPYPSVKHLVVLTSHLHLSCSENAQFYQLHLSNFKNQQMPSADQHDYEVFKPPIFHLEPYYELGDAVLLDVTKAKSAHEAYLRLLTGREIVGKRPFQIQMKQRDQQYLKGCLRILEQRVKDLWDEPWMANIYWEGFV